jgi:hypothetical protein
MGINSNPEVSTINIQRARRGRKPKNLLSGLQTDEDILLYDSGAEDEE